MKHNYTKTERVSIIKKLYRLDGDKLPTMITPHDCIIKEIKKERDFLIFVFEQDISHHDSMENISSLTIKYHLIDEYDIYYQRWNKLFKRSEYIQLKNEKTLFKKESEYLYEYVMYDQLIIKLFQGGREYMLFLSADYVEYDLIPK